MRTKLQIVLFLALAFSFSMGLGAQVQVVIIANPSVKASTISKNDVRNVFTGVSTNLSSGERVKPVLIKEGPTQAAFASSEVGVSQVGLMICWRNLVFSGQATMPKTFEDELSVVSYVAKTPGAIGYVSSATPHEGVKVLAVK